MRWPPLLDWCTDPSCPKLGRQHHAFPLKMEIFLPWQLFPKRNWNLHFASTGSDSTECWSKQDWHDMTAGNGFGWLQSSGLLWLALVQSAAPPAPLVVAARKWNWDSNKFSMATCYFELYIQLKKTIKLGDSPLFSKMYTFSQVCECVISSTFHSFLKMAH